MKINIAQRAFRGCVLMASHRFRWLMLSMMLVSGTVGCRSGQPWFPAPGPINRQQASAVIHDPYPDRDIAPYDLASRPPGYERPLPEPVRNRIVRDSMPWLGR